MTRTSTEFEIAHSGDVFWHRKLMTETLRMADQADLLVAGRVEGGDLTGLRVETPAGAVELSALQVSGLLHTLYLASPEQILNMVRDEEGPDEEDRAADDTPTWHDLLGPIEDGDLMRANTQPGPSGFAIGDWVIREDQHWVGRVNTYDETTHELHVTDDTGDNFWTDMSGWVVIRVRTA